MLLGGGWLLILSEEVETRALPFQGVGCRVWEKECSSGSLERRGRKGTGTGRGVGKEFEFGASRARPLACCIPKDQHNGVSFQLPCLRTPSATLQHNLTHKHTHTCLSCLVSLIKVIICCSQFSMDVSLHVMINNHVHTFFFEGFICVQFL